MEFSGQEYWSGLPFPSPRDLPNLGIEPGSPALQADTLQLSHQGSPTRKIIKKNCNTYFYLLDLGTLGCIQIWASACRLCYYGQVLSSLSPSLPSSFLILSPFSFLPSFFLFPLPTTFFFHVKSFHLNLKCAAWWLFPYELLLFSLSVVSDSATTWTAAHQASLSFTTSQSVLKLMSIE